MGAVAVDTSTIGLDDVAVAVKSPAVFYAAVCLQCFCAVAVGAVAWVDKSMES